MVSNAWTSEYRDLGRAVNLRYRRLLLQVYRSNQLRILRRCPITVVGLRRSVGSRGDITDMSRYTGPVCRLCRREGQKLFLKGQKCYTEKCPVERRQYPPGQHGPAHARRRKQSDYAVQLREKQKVKRIYGLHEKQFRNLFERAANVSGITGDNLIIACLLYTSDAADE